MSVLLLNASYEPIRVIPTRRAVCLVLAEKAEVVAEHDSRLVRSERTAMAAPSVIRLRRFVQIPYRARTPLNRRSLLARDNRECQVAGCDRAGTTIDHVLPRSRGGTHTWENVVAMCAPHNHTKSDRTLAELGWNLKQEPAQPSGARWLLIGWADQPDPVWDGFLAAFT